MLKRGLALTLSILMLLPVCLTARAEYKPQYTTEAEVLYDLGLFKGTGANADGTPILDLDKNATRIQGIVMLIRLLGEEQAALACTAEHPFTDVPTWANKYVAYAYEKKYTNGVGNNTFGSNDKLIGKAYVTFVLRALGYSDAAGDFGYHDALTFGAELGLLESGTCDGALYRDECALLSYNALRTVMKDSDTKLAEKLRNDGVLTDEAVQRLGVLSEKVSIPFTVGSHNSAHHGFYFKGEDILAVFPNAMYFNAAGISTTQAEYEKMEFRLNSIWLGSFPVRQYLEGKKCEAGIVSSGKKILLGINGGNSIATISVMDKNLNLIGYCIIPPGFVCENGELVFTPVFYNGTEEAERLESVFANIKQFGPEALYCEKVITKYADGTEEISLYLRVDEAKWPADLTGFKYYSIEGGGEEATWLRIYTSGQMNTRIKVYGKDTLNSAFFGNDSNDPVYDDQYLYIYDDNKDIVACIRLPEELPIVETITDAGNIEDYPSGTEDVPLSEEALEALKGETDIAVLREAINSVSDFERYLHTMNFSRDGAYRTPEQLVLHGGSEQPQPYCWLMVSVLEDDYPEVGLLHIFKEGVNHNHYTYVKDGDTYYALDVFRSRNINMNIQSTDLEELAAMCLEKVKTHGHAYMDQYEIIRIMGYSGVVKAPNGVTVPLTTDGGTDTFYYAGTTLPLGLGLPRLTDAEIDALLASDDYEYIKETIDTVADMYNFFKRGKYTHACSEFHENGFGYTCSGAQTLLLRSSCISMCNSALYCLEDDYDEMGYVYFSTFDDGHVMNYIKKDGVYYTYDAEICFVDDHPVRWMINYGGSDLIWASEDFQDIADSFKKSKMGDGVQFVYSVHSTGDIVFYSRGSGNNEAEWRRDAYRHYPEGTTAIAWYGDPVIYYKADRDWQSQTAFYDPSVFNSWG